MITEENILPALYVLGNFLLIARFIILLSYLFKFNQAVRIRSHRFLFFYAIVNFSIALFEMIFIYVAKNHTAQILPLLQKFEIDDTFFISPFYYLSEILFYGLAFSYAIGGKWQKILIPVTILLFVLEICNTIWGEGYKDAQTIGSFIFSSFNIFLTLIFVRNFYVNRIKANGLKDSLFVIAWSILIPSCLSILIYLLSKNLFQTDTLLYYEISLFRMLTESICLLLFAYGVSLIKSRKDD